MARLLIGTPGWMYPSWKGFFYPEDLPGRRYLEFYSRSFDSTEVNYSFYQLPRLTTYEKWAAQVPEDFIFALKASRFITHVKRLVDVEEAWTTFVQNALTLGSHLGPILLQFPPSYRCDRKRLAAFLRIAQQPAPQPHTNGQPHRSLDTSRAEQYFGFRALMPLEQGLQRTSDWYDHNRHKLP